MPQDHRSPRPLDPDYFWREAAQCLQRADATERTTVREQWLALAREYEALAVRAEVQLPTIRHRGARQAPTTGEH